MPFSFGPPFVDLPAAEFLGEMLLDSRKFPEAEMAFNTQLERSRLKANSLFGLARAQQQAGKETEARYTWDKLGNIWSSADPELKARLPQ
jgi:TolA-binding protein